MAKARKPVEPDSPPAGIDPQTIADAVAQRLGHSPLSVRNRFAAMSPDQLAQISDAIDGGVDYAALIELAYAEPTKPEQPTEPGN